MVAHWYVNLNGHEQGPLALEDLKRLAQSGALAPDTLIRREGMERPVPATHVKGLLPVRPISITTVAGPPPFSPSAPTTRRVCRAPVEAMPPDGADDDHNDDDEDNAVAAPRHDGLAARPASTSSRAPAGFGIRTGADCIDMVVFFAIVFVLAII